MPARVMVRRRGTGFRPEGGFEHRFRAMTATHAARPTERARQARTGLASGCSMLRRCTRSISCASSKPNSKLLIRHRILLPRGRQDENSRTAKKWRRPHAMERRAGCRAERGRYTAAWQRPMAQRTSLRTSGSGIPGRRFQEHQRRRAGDLAERGRRLFAQVADLV